MLRYFRLYRHFLAFSFSRAFEFRIDFLIRVIMDIIYYAVNIGFYQVLFKHTTAIGGWNEDQAMVFVGAYLVVDAINMTVFADNLWYFDYLIRKGDLDYYLTRPVSPLFFISLRSFSAASFMNLMLAGGFLTWAILSGSFTFSGFQLILFLLLLLNGAFLHYIVIMFANIPIFWWQSNGGFISIAWGLTRFMERPDKIFTGIARKLFTTLLPFCLMASFPTRLLFDVSWRQTTLHILCITIGLFFLMVSFWRRGLRAYSSASS